MPYQSDNNHPVQQKPVLLRNIFKTQLRAIFRASIYGNLSIMYPMITSVSEVRKIKEIVEEIKEELTAEQLPFVDV